MRTSTDGCDSGRSARDGFEVGPDDGLGLGAAVGELCSVGDVVGSEVGDVVGSEVVGARVSDMLRLVAGLGICAVTCAVTDVCVVPLTETDTGDDSMSAATSRATCMVTPLPLKRLTVVTMDPATTSH